jgi:hypothetical protein
VAKFKQDITRLVLDLKTEVNTTITILKPTVEYNYRLVLDVHPMHKALAADDSSFDSSTTSNASDAKAANDNGAQITLEQLPVFEPDMESDLTIGVEQ